MSEETKATRGAERGGALSLAEVRLHRTMLLVGGLAYLAWWLVVHWSLPNAYNPFLGRAAVVACWGLLYGASFASAAIARRLDVGLALACSLATAHFFYLFARNDAEVNWVIGSYIIIVAVCAVLQTASSLLGYSLFAAACSIVVLAIDPNLFAVFLPGVLTILFFANLGLRTRLRLMAQLKESHGRVASLFDAGFEGIAVHEGGIIREVNATFPRLVGRPRESLLGTNIDDLLVATAPVTDSQAEAYEAALVREDGTRLAVLVAAKNHVLDGRSMRLVAVRDQTARRRAELALERANSELEAFSHSVAHDLRSPLRGIDGFSQVLLEDYADRLDEPGRGHLRSVRAATQRMGELIDDLLALAQVSRTELAREPLDVSRLAAEVVETLRTRDRDRKVDVEIEPSLVASADRRLVLVVFENLLGNAWKFTSKTEGAHIWVGASSVDGETVYTVRDDGAGFDMAFVDKLFTPFRRLHGVREFPGSGIGLSTVKRIVDRHGGRIWAEGAVGKGATISFTLDSRHAAQRT